MSERFVAADGTVITYSQGKVDIEKKPVVDMLWEPEMGESCWIVTGYGEVEERERGVCSDEDDYCADSCYWDMGNIYQTEAKAEAAAKKQKAATKIKRWIAEKNQGWVPDWKNVNQAKVYLYSGYESGLSVIDVVLSKYQDNAYYMKSYEIARQLLKELPEECNLVFGINS